jgi:hypothetical protein
MRAIIFFKMPFLVTACHLACLADQLQAEFFSDSFPGVYKDNELCGQTCIEEGHTNGGHCAKFRSIFVCYCKGKVVEPHMRIKSKADEQATFFCSSIGPFTIQKSRSQYFSFL